MQGILISEEIRRTDHNKKLPLAERFHRLAPFCMAFIFGDSLLLLGHVTRLELVEVPSALIVRLLCIYRFSHDSFRRPIVTT